MILCDNTKCHMREICGRANLITNGKTEIRHFEPLGASCDHFIEHHDHNYSKDEMDAMRHQIGAYDKKTKSLF